MLLHRILVPFARKFVIPYAMQWYIFTTVKICARPAALSPAQHRAQLSTEPGDGLPEKYTASPAIPSHAACHPSAWSSHWEAMGRPLSNPKISPGWHGCSCLHQWFHWLTWCDGGWCKMHLENNKRAGSSLLTGPNLFFCSSNNNNNDNIKILNAQLYGNQN